MALPPAPLVAPPTVVSLSNTNFDHEKTRAMSNSSSFARLGERQTSCELRSHLWETSRCSREVGARSSEPAKHGMGGAPTPIPWGELYTALQQGMVDGAENNPPSLLTSRHFEVTKHYSLDEHTRIPDIVVFSQRIWDDPVGLLRDGLAGKRMGTGAHGRATGARTLTRSFEIQQHEVTQQEWGSRRRVYEPKRSGTGWSR
jgi:hypothetical protein